MSLYIRFPVRAYNINKQELDANVGRDPLLDD